MSQNSSPDETGDEHEEYHVIQEKKGAQVYDLKRCHIDYPWTRVKKARYIRPYRPQKENWFDACPSGWGDIIREHLEVLDRMLDESGYKDRIVINDVKEKFGTLRVYFDFPIITDAGQTLPLVDARFLCTFAKQVMALERDTQKVCRYCGKPSQTIGGTFMDEFMCDDCAKEQNRS